MSDTAIRDDAGGPATEGAFQLTPQQIEYFHTFGFLKFPGLFAPDIERMIAGFEDAFATRPPDKVIKEDPLQDTDNQAFADRRRMILYHIVEQSDKLRWLATDPRVLGIVHGIIGQQFEARPTDAHIFHCDTSWHPDMGSDPRFRLKLSFYLDPQRANSGAIRVIPGSNHPQGTFAPMLLKNLYGNPKKVKQSIGVEADEIPCWTVETNPGDLVCWNFRTFHATFHGFERRRLLSMTFCEAA